MPQVARRENILRGKSAQLPTPTLSRATARASAPRHQSNSCQALHTTAHQLLDRCQRFRVISWRTAWRARRVKETQAFRGFCVACSRLCFEEGARVAHARPLLPFPHVIFRAVTTHVRRQRIEDPPGSQRPSDEPRMPHLGRGQDGHPFRGLSCPSADKRGHLSVLSVLSVVVDHLVTQK